MADQKPVESNLGKWTSWIFFLNLFSQQFGIMVTLQFMNLFMTDYALMDPLVLASVLSVGRIIDMALSFVAGTIVQKANLKAGPYRTWILINGPLMCIGIFLIFLNPDIPPAGKLVVFVIGYLFRNCPQNFLLVAQSVLISKVAGTNMKDRVTLTARGTQGSNLSSILVSLFTVAVIEFLNAKIGNGRGYLIVGVGYCIIQSICQYVIYRGLAPYDQYDPDEKKVEGSAANVKVAHMYGDTFRNPQIWILLLSTILKQIAMFTMTPMTAYVFRYSIGNIQFLSLNNTVAAVLGLFVAFIIPPFAIRLGKKNSQIVSGLATGLGYAMMAFFGNANLIVLIAMTCWNRLCLGLSTTIGVNNFIDAAEYQLYKTGRDSRPFIMGLNAITMKVGQTLSSFATAWILIFCNYEALGGGRANIDPVKLCLGTYGLLAALYALSSVVMMMFSVTDAKAKEYADANKIMLAERRAAVTGAPKA